MNLESITKEVMARLKSNYGKTTDIQIRGLLNSINIVMLTHKGIGTMYGYYTLGEEKIREIIARPRNISHAFSPGQPGLCIPYLEVKETIPFFVKSSSRFFLKPDIGEVFDQMTDEQKDTATAICIVRNSEIEVDNGNGDHFLMSAEILGPKSE